MKWKHLSRIGCILAVLIGWTIMACLEGTPPYWGPAPITWNKTFGGSNDDKAYSVVQTTDGGYIVAAETSSYGAGGNDAWLIKTDVLGNELWNKTFGGAYDDEAFSVAHTTDGGYILAGTTSSYGSGNYDAWLIKTDEDGNEQWNKTFGGTYNDEAFSVAHTTDGGYIVAGATTSYGSGNNDVWLIKTDTNGNEEWSTTFEFFPCIIASTSVHQTTDGGYIVSAYILSYHYDIFGILIKTDGLGKEQWNKGFLNSALYSVAETTDERYIAAGFADPLSTGNYDAWLIKTDALGNEQWNKTFGGSGYDGADWVAQTADEGYIVAGLVDLAGTGSHDAWLIKTDALGNEQWNKTFGGSNDDEATSVEQTEDGGYVIVGYTQSYGAGSSDVWLIKTDANGNAPATPSQ